MKMSQIIFKVLTLLCLLNGSFAARLSVSGTDLTYNGEKVYLNGANIAWNSYGYDFGNGNYDGSIESWLTDIGANGGNTARIWVHVEGFNTPSFDAGGYVTGCDNTGSFVNDVRTFLDAAQRNNILVILALWNGAYLSNQNAIDLIWDDSKMDSYISNCLNGFIAGVAGHPALGAWEAVNEPEGSVQVASDVNPCYDTTIIGPSGAGWTGLNIPMQRWLRFIGRINQAVRANDPSGLTTLGSWGQFPQSDAFSNTRNHYKDSCLNGAVDSGANGQIDFYQMHTYDWGGTWSPNAPFTVQASAYGLNKPVVLGEYASVCAAGNSLSGLNTYAYENDYSGGLSWHWAATGDCSDTRGTQQSALSAVDGRTDHGIVNINVG